MKKIEKGKLIAIIISIVIGISVVLFIDFNSTVVKIAFTEPKPTQEEYDILKDYALDVANGAKIDENQDVKVEKKIEEDFLKIKIETSNMYGVDANFPISAENNIEIENGTIKYEATIKYEEATYSEYTDVNSKAYYIFTNITLAVVIALMFYVVFIWAPQEWKTMKKQIS